MCPRRSVQPAYWPPARRRARGGVERSPLRAVELREAVDARCRSAVRLVLALPARDDHPLLRLVRDDALASFDVVAVPDNWPLRCRQEALAREGRRLDDHRLPGGNRDGA